MKAYKWLNHKGLEYKLMDIVKEPPLEKYLELSLKQYSSDLKSIFNTRGKSFKSIDQDVSALSNNEIIQLLLSDGKLIKRPFLVYEEKEIILGFNQEIYTNFFAKN